MPIKLKTVVGTALTHNEVDTNFSSLFYSASISGSFLVLHTTGSSVQAATTTPINVGLGNQTTASGIFSNAQGFNTIASGSYQNAQGQYNMSSSAQSAFIIGNGTSTSARSNLVFASGSEVQITGSLRVSGSIAGVITGSLFGSASHASTASYLNPLNQAIIVTGSLTQGAPGNIASGVNSHAEGISTSTSTTKAHIGDSLANRTASLSSTYGNIASQFPAGNYVVIDDNSFTGNIGVTTALILSSSYNAPNTKVMIANGSTTTQFYIINVSLIRSAWNGDQSYTGQVSHVEGVGNIAIGYGSHAEGYLTSAIGGYSHAQGELTRTAARGSHAEGYGTLAIGDNSHAEGDGATAIGVRSHAEGDYAIASGSWSHAEGSNTKAVGIYAHAEGTYTLASGYSSHTEGTGTIASGQYSHTEGTQTRASANYSHAEGSYTYATGDYSHAEGQYVYAQGAGSHAEGLFTSASGRYSHAEGTGTRALGTGSHAEGYYTTASGNYSHAEGLWTVASGSHQHVQGLYNISSSTQGAFIVGNGNSDATRRNLIFAGGVAPNGVVQITGSLLVTGSTTLNNILIITPRTTTPTPLTGMVIVSGSGANEHIYCYLNSTWKQLD